MKKALLVLIVAVAAQAETATLLTAVSSKMPTGTEFTAKGSQSNHVYHGVVVTQKARNFFRRGTLLLRFDENVRVVHGTEGTFKASRKMQIAVAGGSTLAAKLADDAVDGTVGAGKARYVGLSSALLVILFTNGGKVSLRPGCQLELETIDRMVTTPALEAGHPRKIRGLSRASPQQTGGFAS